METYLRLMFLKHRYRLGYQTLCGGDHLKHRYGLDRIRLDGLTDGRTCCGHGIFAHNLVLGESWAAYPSVACR